MIEDREGEDLSYHTTETPEAKDSLRDSGARLDRIDALEDNFNKFQLHMATRMGDLEMLSQKFSDELITQLKDQYERERAKTKTCWLSTPSLQISIMTTEKN